MPTFLTTGNLSSLQGNELAKGGTEDCSAAKCLSLVLSCSKVTEPSADSVWQKNWAGQGGVGRVAG